MTCSCSEFIQKCKMEIQLGKIKKIMTFGHGLLSTNTDVVELL